MHLPRTAALRGAELFSFGPGHSSGPGSVISQVEIDVKHGADDVEHDANDKGGAALKNFTDFLNSLVSTVHDNLALGDGLVVFGFINSMQSGRVPIAKL